MTEKLIVKNFAGIEAIELEIRKINILIGPQASGKSICAKLLFYFKNFIEEIFLARVNNPAKRELDSVYAKAFEEYFPSSLWSEHNFLIRYESGDDFIEVQRREDYKNQILLTYSHLFKQVLVEIEQQEKTNEKALNQREYMINSLADLMAREIISTARFFNLFIPAGRSFFASLQSNIFTFFSTENHLDPFLIKFGIVYENMKNIHLYAREGELEEDPEHEMKSLIEKSLCGRYVREKGQDFLDLTDGRRINIANASSGQQEILPLTIALSALPVINSKTVYIEEPEAHLFPNTQRYIVELIATVFNIQPIQFFITTHSPYILTVFNNLLQAGLLYAEGDQGTLTALEKIVPSCKALNPSDLSAYVLADGKCQSIVSTDTGLIDATIIDSVSDELAIEFDKLLDLI